MVFMVTDQSKLIFIYNISCNKLKCLFQPEQLLYIYIVLGMTLICNLLRRFDMGERVCRLPQLSPGLP